MSDTPLTDSAERFMYSDRAQPVGFISSQLGRALERELNVARLALKTGATYSENALFDGGEKHAQASAETAGIEDLGVLGQNSAPAPENVLTANREGAGNDVPANQTADAVPAPVRAAAPVGPAMAPEGEAAKRRASPENAGDFVEYEPGEVLFNKGDPANHMAVITAGSVEIFAPEHDRRIAVIGKGNCFGEQAILNGGVRGASVRAIEKVTCLEIKTENLRVLLSADTGLLMPAVEALLLQLCMANGIARVVQTPGAQRAFEVISKSRLSSVQGRKVLNHALANTDGHGLSSDQLLFLKLQSSEKLHESLFSAGQQLGCAGEAHSGLAHVITEGEVDAVKGEMSVRLGIGSVIGVAEGFGDSPLLMTYTAVDSVTALILPMDQVLRGFERANPGIRAVVRYTSARIIELAGAL